MYASRPPCSPGSACGIIPVAPRSVDVSIMVAILASFRIAQYRTAFMRALTDERSNARGGVWGSPGPVAGNDDMGANDSADAEANDVASARNPAANSLDTSLNAIGQNPYVRLPALI